MHCWARYLFFAVILVLGVGNMVTACGQKGDLYMVDESKTTEDPYRPGTPQDDVPQPPAQPAQPAQQ